MLKISPEYTPTKQLLAYLLADSAGDLARAETLIREVLTATPTDRNAQWILGWITALRGNHDEGLNQMEGVAGDYEMGISAEFWEHLGDAYQLAKRMDAARKAYDRALDNFPPSTPSEDRRRNAVRTKLENLKSLR